MIDDQKPADLDLRKFALDERKFDFEVQKYNEDKASRELQREKTTAELRELTKPWWRKAVYISPLVTIGVAIVGGVIAFGTNALKSNLPHLLQERADLTKVNSDLRASNSALSSQIAAAKGQIGTLEKQKDQLASQLPLDRFQALLAVLQRKTASAPLLMADPLFWDALQAAVEGPHLEVMAIIQKKRADAACPPTLKAGLTFILYKITSDPKYKAGLADESLHAFDEVVKRGRIRDRNAVEPYATILSDRTVFTLQERVEHLRQMYARIDTSGMMFTIDYTLDYVLATMDEDASTRIRDPWIEYLFYAELTYERTNWSSLNDAIIPAPASKPSIALFSPEGFAVQVMKLVTRDNQNMTAETDAAPGILSSPSRCPFPASAPLCSTFIADREERAVANQEGRSLPRAAFIVRGGDADRFKRWLADNPSLAELFSPPYSQMMGDLRMKKFKALPDSTFRKVLRGEWITEAETAAGH